MNTGEITLLLANARSGDKAAEEKLATVVSDELRRIAARHMRRERPNHTLQPTALVNDAFVQLMAQDKDWHNRAHFFAVASSIMHRILVDYARERNAAKRGGGVPALAIETVAFGQKQPQLKPFEEMLAIHEALSRLKELDERQFRVVEMKFFGGMSEEEIGAFLAVSARTVKREWSLARAWLHAELSR